MRSHPDRDEGTDGRDDPNDRQVKDMTTATTSSLPSSVIPAGRSGTDSHDRSRPSLFLGTRPPSEDKAADDLLHSPTLPSRPQPHTVDADLPAPVEAGVWDWQAPSFGSRTQRETSDPALTYFYEPQGELLLHEPTGPAGARADEFNIPGPVLSPVVDPRRQSTDPLEALLTGASVPGNNSSSRAGAKRKSTTDLYETATKKRTLEMGEPDRTGDRVNAQSGKTSPMLERRNLPAAHPTASAAPLVLPARKVFPIQIGDKLFRLSGASISSDGK